MKVIDEKSVHFNAKYFPVILHFPHACGDYVRQALEFYFNVPSLPVAYSIELHDSKIVWGKGTSGLDYEYLNAPRIIYVHRNPIDVVFEHLRCKSKLGAAGPNYGIILAQYISHVKSYMAENGGQEIVSISFDEFDGNLKEELPKLANQIIEWHKPKNNKWWIKDMTKSPDGGIIPFESRSIQEVQKRLNDFGYKNYFKIDSKEEIEYLVEYQRIYGDKIVDTFNNETGLNYSV